MSPNGLSLASFSISATPPWHTMFSSPATSNLRSSCLNFNSAFPKLLYLGPKFLLGHLTLASASESESESEPKPLDFDLPVLPCVCFEQQLFAFRHLSLHLLVCFTRVHGPSDSLESEGSTRSLTDTPRVFSTLSASVLRVRLSLRSPIVTVLLGWTSTDSALALTLVVFWVRSLFALFWCDPELCCRSPPFGAPVNLAQLNTVPARY